MEEKQQNANHEENKSKVPHIFVILFVIIALGAIASYIVPAGNYERVTNEEGIEVIDPESFTYEESTPISLFDFMISIPTGFYEAIEIVFGILMIGGMFAVIERTGIISLGVGKLANRFSSSGVLVIPILMIPFALITAFTSQIELALIYLPAILPLMLRLGFDKVTAAGTVLISTVAGFTMGITSPANVGVAQEVSSLPLYSGMGYRIIMLAVILTIGILFVMRYASNVRRNPELSVTYGESNGATLSEEKGPLKKATKRQIGASFVVVLAFAILIYGLVVHGWYFRELAGLYILTAIIVGIVGGIGASKIADSFLDGMKDILLGAAIVGVARGVAVVLEQGNIMDTIIYASGNIVEAMPSSITAIIMFVVQAMLNFFIPSGSGQAMVTMPIMSGIADIAGISRQTAVLAFLFGDGIANIFYPTSGYFMAALAIGGIKWENWMKFIWPLLIFWYSFAIIFLLIAQWIQY